MEIPNVMKIVLGVILIAFVGVGFYFVQWKTPMEERKAAEESIVQLNNEMTQVQRDLDSIESLRTQLNNAEAELQAVIQQELTPESEKEFVASYLADVEKMVEHERSRMADPDFTLMTIAPEGNAKSGDSPASLASYPVKTFNMTLKGRYATVIDFLRQLGALKLKRLVTVNKISLNGQYDKDSYSKSPVLSVTIPLSVYLRKDGSK